MYREGEIEKGHENQLPMFHEHLLQKESQPSGWGITIDETANIMMNMFFKIVESNLDLKKAFWQLK